MYERETPGGVLGLPLSTGGEGLNGGTKRSSSFLSCSRFWDSKRRCCCWCSRFLMRKIFGILTVASSFFAKSLSLNFFYNFLSHWVYNQSNVIIVTASKTLIQVVCFCWSYECHCVIVHCATVCLRKIIL